MHTTARKFIASIAPYVTGRVCEIGSRNVNGSIRHLFRGPYVGVDILAGPGVDIVEDATEWDGDGEKFDCVVCCEVLEHHPIAYRLVGNMVRLTRPGGMILITAASTGREPHSAIDGQALRTGEHYANIGQGELRDWLNCRTVMVDASIPGDVYCLAIR